MPEPFLDFGDVGLMLQGVGGGGGAHGMGADAIDGPWKVGKQGVVADQPIDRIGMERFFEGAGDIVPNWPENRPVAIVDVPSTVDIVFY